MYARARARARARVCVCVYIYIYKVIRYLVSVCADSGAWCPYTDLPVDVHYRGVSYQFCAARISEWV